MDLSVLMSWLKFVQIPFAKNSAIITSYQARIILKLSSNFSNQSSLSPQLILMNSKLQLNPVGVLSRKGECFVGARIDINCNEVNSCDTLTKKNTLICGRGVLKAVRYTIGTVIIPILAHRNYSCNNFAECYV